MESRGLHSRGATTDRKGTLGALSLILLLVPVYAVAPLLAPALAAVPGGTFSIVAYDPETQEIGVAVQSRAFSVGSAVPWVEAGVGAIATQASTNESFGPRGLELLRQGHSPAQVIETLLAGDPDRASRQIGVADARGRSAAWTGGECLTWAGDSTQANLSAQGNILAGPAVVAEMVRAFHETSGELAERLLAALVAAQAAGGDTRGQQSAAILVGRPSDLYPEYRTRYVDLRVEDHAAPIEELLRVYRMHEAGDLVRAHTRYAALYDSLRDVPSALRERKRVAETLQHALERGDASAGTLNGLAWYCALADLNLEQALTAAKRAVELEPESFEILDTLAEVHFRLGHRDEAVAVARRALALQPEDAYLKSQLERFESAPAGGGK